jgi:hypothetical protein
MWQALAEMMAWRSLRVPLSLNAADLAAQVTTPT